MKTTDMSGKPARTLIAAAVAAIVLAACATTPTKPDGAAEARSKLTQLQSDPNLAGRAPQALEAADAAVRLAEQPEADSDLAAYRVYLADRKIDIARADAQTRFAEDQRALIRAQGEQARLDARTHEANVAERQAAIARSEQAEQKAAADQARSEANIAQGQAAVARAEGDQQRVAADQARGEANVAQGQAAAARGDANAAQGQAAAARDDANAAQGQAAAARAEGSEQRQAADQARGEADAARQAAASSDRQVTDLQSQVAALQARPTDRGLVLTLGDALFNSGRADLQPGANGHLGRLVAFLNRYPGRTVVIEGYTDSLGNDNFNQGLSERRAGAVKSYLIEQGVSSARLTASGKGASDPVASNETAAGRQQNRRVEVIISDPAAASR
ncbi:MAG TPA: OmpA family protein [Steroidobacteraceae bacterium]|jgi:outer membrane protein OmpA-like peptidoglycan-associated protein|nr:OmpA family protein [Steroidobacteraceae bacterium]